MPRRSLRTASILSLVGLFFLLAAAIVMPASPVSAGSATYSSSLTGASPAFNRPAICSRLSVVGTNVFYHEQSFTVDTSGSYTLTNDSNTFPDGTFGPNDSFLALYSPSFNPASPLTNCIAVDNDINFPSDLRAQIITNLTAATTYILVTTSFENGVEGDFTNSIAGPGNISGSGLTTFDNTPTPTSTPTPTPTDTPNRLTVIALLTAGIPPDTATPTPSPTVTDTPTVTSTPTDTSTPTTIPTPGRRPPPATETPTATPTGTATPAPSVTTTLTPSVTATPTQTGTATTIPTPGRRP